MVAISPPAKVLVTGANGYLATWVVKKYLEAGYSVRGTRLPQRKFAQYGDRFELVVVEDITKDGAFDEAIKGIDAIAHTASPFHYKSTHPTACPIFPECSPYLALRTQYYPDLIIPAYPGATFFNESNWNDAAVETVKTKGSEAGSVAIYWPRRHWQRRPRGTFPQSAPTVDDINTSQREIYDTLTGARGDTQLPGQGNWVHVAVASEAHVRATHAAAAGGQRIIVKSGPFFFKISKLTHMSTKQVDAAAELGVPNVPRGEPGSTKGVSFIINLETKKAEELLGLTTATPLKDVVAESVEDFKARGYPGFTA
ncbi:hypothetical protein BJV77DRAFT_962959 [Russula vinacea]|nr:hypothetical protein BJV77DRAFT_962959 [Russula vinacea]